jgi:prepilin peptidase CpaA
MSPNAAILGACLALSVAALLWGAISDLRAYVIPNRVSALIVLAFVVAVALTPHIKLVDGLIGGAIGLTVGAALFALKWMGGGDVKLFAALSLWAGLSRLAPLALVTSLAGAVVSLVMISPLRRFAPPPSTEAQAAAAQPVPYGLAIAAGGLWLFAQYARLLV